MIHGGAIKVRSYSSSSEEPADLTRMNLRHIISQLVWECFSVASCLFVSAAFPQVFPFLITLVLCLALFASLHVTPGLGFYMRLLKFMSSWIS